MRKLTFIFFALIVHAFSAIAQASEPGALRVEIPTLQFADDVRNYINAVLAAPIPEGYVLPAAYWAADMRYEDAVALVGKRYPQFNNLEDDDLLRAVKNHPLAYQSLILEARSVREKYFGEKFNLKEKE